MNSGIIIFSYIIYGKNLRNKKNLNINNEIWFKEGEYKDNKRWNWIEYNEDGKLIFEGENKNDKRWNGKGKEYPYLDDKLIFDWEYKNGRKWKKGKEYNYNGELIFV